MTNLTLHQVHGTGVALNGTADSWIVGVQREDTSFLIIYDKESWSQMAWGEAFPQEPIILENISQPTQIYETNQKTIGDVMNASEADTSEVDLSNGVYTISVRSSTGLSMIRFNASTGELLSPSA